MGDPEIRELLDKAEELRLVSERLIEQASELKEKADQLITESKKLAGKRSPETAVSRFAIRTPTA